MVVPIVEMFGVVLTNNSVNSYIRIDFNERQNVPSEAVKPLRKIGFPRCSKSSS